MADWGRTTLFRDDMLKMVFQNIAMTGVGDAGGLLGSSVAGSLYLSLHTATPSDAAASGQATSESAYAGYARVAVARSASNFVLLNGGIELANDIAFPKATGSATAVVAWGIGVASAGSTRLLYAEALDSSITIANGVVPVLLGGTGNSILAFEGLG